MVRLRNTAQSILDRATNRMPGFTENAYNAADARKMTADEVEVKVYTTDFIIINKADYVIFVDPAGGELKVQHLSKSHVFSLSRQDYRNDTIKLHGEGDSSLNGRSIEGDISADSTDDFRAMSKVVEESLFELRKFQINQLNK
jgi:hypothetical protein